jgi:hypothetical protein
VQWRFIGQGRNPYFTIANRKTGNSLCNSSGTSVTASGNPNTSKYYWALDAAGTDISITNLSSSNVVSYVNGAIQALSGDASDATRQWVISPVRMTHIYQIKQLFLTPDGLPYRPYLLCHPLLLSMDEREWRLVLFQARLKGLS